MASLSGILGRIRGDQTVALAAEVATLREVVLNINHVVLDVQQSVAELQQLQSVVLELNHDVRAGAERSLPLFLGYAERLRLDADTAIGATEVIERQLAVLDRRLEGGDAGGAADDSTVPG